MHWKNPWLRSSCPWGMTQHWISQTIYNGSLHLTSDFPGTESPPQACLVNAFRTEVAPPCRHGRWTAKPTMYATCATCCVRNDFASRSLKKLQVKKISSFIQLQNIWLSFTMFHGKFHHLGTCTADRKRGGWKLEKNRRKSKGIQWFQRSLGHMVDHPFGSHETLTETVSTKWWSALSMNDIEWYPGSQPSSHPCGEYVLTTTKIQIPHDKLLEPTTTNIETPTTTTGGTNARLTFATVIAVILSPKHLHSLYILWEPHRQTDGQIDDQSSKWCINARGPSSIVCELCKPVARGWILDQLLQIVYECNVYTVFHPVKYQ